MPVYDDICPQTNNGHKLELNVNTYNNNYAAILLLVYHLAILSYILLCSIIIIILFYLYVGPAIEHSH